MIEKKSNSAPWRVFLLLSCVLCVHATGRAQKQPMQPKSEALPEMPAKVYNKVAKATANIICNDGQANGAGVVVGITPNGRALILTACHVVASNFKETDPDIPLEFYRNLKVKIASEVTPVSALVLPNRVDRANDLALIVTRERVTGNEVIIYTRTQELKPGEKVAAFGYPQTDRLSQTVGRITRLEPKYLVFDARIAPGNSGGPLVEKNGRMIGVSIFVEQKTEGYALHMNLVLPIVEDWLRETKLSKQWKFEKDGFPLWPVIGGGVALGVGSAILLSRGAKNDSTTTPNVFPFPGRPTRN